MQSLYSHYRLGFVARTFAAACLEATQISIAWVTTAASTVYQIATHPRALAGYRLAWYVSRELAIITWLFLLFVLAWCSEQIDVYVQSCLEQQPPTDPQRATTAPTPDQPMLPAPVVAPAATTPEPEPVAQPEQPEPETPQESAHPQPLENLGVRQLRQLAKDRQITGFMKLSKKELLNRLAA